MSKKSRQFRREVNELRRILKAISKMIRKEHYIHPFYHRWVMKILKPFRLDIKYATEVMGWEWEKDALPPGHFHRKGDLWPVYRRDY